MNILVTGGCGYTGSILVEKLLKKKHKVTSIDTQWFGNFLKKHKNLKNLKLNINDIDKISLKKFHQLPINGVMKIIFQKLDAVGKLIILMMICSMLLHQVEIP